MKLFSYFSAIILTFSLLNPSFSEDVKKPQDSKVVRMEDIKQEILGLDKEYTRGRLIKIKVSPLPASENTITAMYKFTLLKNGKKSEDFEILSNSAKNTDPQKSTSDLIFTIPCDFTGKYQVIFAATYIETKTGTNEVIRVYNPEVLVYDVKMSGAAPDVPDIDPDVPAGKFGIIKPVYQAALKLDVPKEKKTALFEGLANSFSSMSSTIAAGVYKDSADEATQAENINKFLKAAIEQNNKAIENVLGKEGRSKFDGTIDVVVKKKLDELFDSGKMRKFSDYQDFWAEVSEGFRQAMKGVQ